MTRRDGGPGARRRRWALCGIAAAASGALLLAVSYRLCFPAFHFPPPAGPYALGTLTYHWVDADRVDLLAPLPNQARELMVQLWYPAKPEPHAPRTAYIADAKLLAPLAQLLRVPSFTLRHLPHITTNAVTAAAVAEPGRRYPVLIFSHGRGGYRQHDTWLMEQLASRGYERPGPRGYPDRREP